MFKKSMKNQVKKKRLLIPQKKSLNEANKDQIKLKEDLTVDTVELTLKESSENKKENNEVENKDYQGKLNEEASEKEKKLKEEASEKEKKIERRS